MSHRRLREAFDPEHIAGVVRQVYRDQVTFHDGDSEIAPGISVHHIGGHTLGLQAVRVNTRRGWVVLASDASHFYANFEQRRAFPNVVRVEEMLEGYRRLQQLAESPKHIVPGHDPEVMRRYMPPSPELSSICVRLDVEPVELVTPEREVPSEIVGTHQS
jgi:glyoxylase-like metal-dependent hydrolase (beta-lactamase superfamily II)